MNFAQKLTTFLTTLNRILRSKALILRTKQGKYFSASVLDIICIILILLNGKTPATHLVTPFVSTLAASIHNPFSQKQLTRETFAFAPGDSLRNLNNIDFASLTYLPFFDVPVDRDGTLFTDTYMYETFRGDGAAEVFATAHQHGTKVLLTLTQFRPQTTQAFLDDSIAQERLINNVVTEVKETGIDGVNIAFEAAGPFSRSYQVQFSRFLDGLTNRLHAEVPNSTVAVSVGHQALAGSLYDLKSVGSTVDKVFVEASNIAALEAKNGANQNPVYGFNEEEFFKTWETQLNAFSGFIPVAKLVAERAYYGNGNNFRIYTPSTTPDTSVAIDNSDIQADSATLDRLVSGVPDNAKNAARRNLPYIIQALRDEHILNPGVLAYAMATIEHETDGTFEPIDEIQGRFSARRLGYEGGQDYFGRGFIQLTHLRNYKAMGERIGMGDELVKHPELASKPEVAAKILAAFFQNNNIATLAANGQYVAARAPVNPDKNGYHIAMLAGKYEL